MLFIAVFVNGGIVECTRKLLKRESRSLGIRVLFLYPNTYGMNMLPPAIAFFSAILKQEGHEVELFDATYYQMDYGIDSDGSKIEALNVVPFDMGKHGLRKRDSKWEDDLRKQVERFQPDLIALSSTEDMWELGMKLLESIEIFC